MATSADRAMSFGAIAADYDRLRPEPAEAAVDWLVPPGDEVAVDLGAGTGKLTRALARRVPRVIAVEPDERMRAVLAARSPGIEVRDGTGEAIPLPDASADGVFISSAWHWMDPERAVAEITRVLRDGGRLGLMRRDRPADGDGNTAAGLGGRAPWRAAVMPAGPDLGSPETESFTFTRAMTIDALIEQLGTYSGVITASPADRAAGLDRARAALEELFPGAAQIEVPMRTRCWRATRLPRAGR
jgi:ubiquinone/menaquinone biosynthesis C-methylase UbiE